MKAKARLPLQSHARETTTVKLGRSEANTRRIDDTFDCGTYQKNVYLESTRNPMEKGKTIKRTTSVRMVRPLQYVNVAVALRELGLRRRLVQSDGQKRQPSEIGRVITQH